LEVRWIAGRRDTSECAHVSYRWQMPGRLDVDVDLNDAGAVRIIAKPLHDGRIQFSCFQLGPDDGLHSSNASLVSTAPIPKGILWIFTLFLACDLSHPRLTKPLGLAYIHVGRRLRIASLLAGMLETTRPVHFEQTNRARDNANFGMQESIEFDLADYAVIVKIRGSGNKPWKWEITAPGKKQPVRQSTESFDSMSTALRAGREALRTYLQRTAG
jgi:hypothetical protein